MTFAIVKAVKDMEASTDLWGWYWLSYGEKCYAFAVVEAFPAEKGAEIPEPGSELKPHPEKDRAWVGENGVEMIIDREIASRESQDGGAICRFIAAAHAWHLGPAMKEVATRDIT